MTRRTDATDTPQGAGDSPASREPVTLKTAPALTPVPPHSWTPRLPPLVEPSPTVSVRPGSGDVIRGGAAADRDLDALVEREHGVRERVGTVIAERYRVIRRIGAGGVGTVYLALDGETGRHVAVKLLHWELSYLPEVIGRFEREALAASRIDHPNVAGASDFGRLPDGACFLVLELVEGQTLAEVLAREGALPPTRALQIARQVTAGLAAAHRAGIIHRDLKPDNVMLVPCEGGPDRVKVLDFGIAHVPAEEGARVAHSQRGNIFGTPEYMAPEQAAGTIVDHRADLYTVGILLYEMLSGRAPFRGEGMHSVLELQMTAKAAPLPTTVAPPLAALVAQLMAKDPDLRPPTADDVGRRIDVLLGEGVAPSTRTEAVGPSPTSTPLASLARVTLPDDPDSAPASVRNPPSPPSSIRIGGREFRLGVLVGALALAAAALVVALIVVAQVGHPLADTTAVPAQLGSSELDALAHRAAGGDPEALSRLEQNPPTTGRQWAAVGRGHASLRAYEPSARAYARALALDPKLSDDDTLVSDLRNAADVPAARDTVLTIAQTRLGARGADLVYDVWAAAQADPAGVELAQRTQSLLRSPPLRAVASPALAMALELWDGKTCEDYRALLPRAAQHADARSAPVLRTLMRDKGCGKSEKDDCFACLRGSPALKDALESAERRIPPRL